MASSSRLTGPKAVLATLVVVCTGFLAVTDAWERLIELWPGDNEEYAIEDYVTTDPDDPPAKQSTWLELVGIQSGMPLEDIEAMFPKDETKRRRDVGDDGVAWHSWQWRNVTVGVAIKDGVAHHEQSLSIDADSGDEDRLYVSMPGDLAVPPSDEPNDLLLGHATVRDVVARLDQPFDASSVAEGTTVPWYWLEYITGPDASVTVTYNAYARKNVGDFPFKEFPIYRRPIREAACDELVSSVSLQDPSSLREGRWPKDGLCAASEG